MEYSKTEEKRFQKTLRFLKRNISKSDKILDPGIVNALSKLMIAEGYSVKNIPE